MKRNKKNNINRVLFKRNRSRSITGLFVLILLTFMLFGTLWTFLFMPALGIVTQQRFFRSEQFDRVDETGITDGNGYIEFLDKDYNVVYPHSSSSIYTSDDVENMVNLYSIQQEVKKYSYIKNGEVYTEIAAGNSDADYGWNVKLDSDLNYVDSANFNYIKETYTEQDIEYIINEYIRDLRTYKYDFVSDSGQNYTMVTVLEEKIEFLELYEIVILIAMAVFLVLLYILFIIFSTRSTSRLFRHPLKDLSNAINDLSSGKHTLINQEYYIDEFNSIVEVFNNMVYTLNDLENKNIILTNQKQSMIANISHDLKTPITIIQGYIDAIRSGKAKGTSANEYLDKIYSKSEYMTALINSFADFSKLNHPDFRLKLSDENLCIIVRNYLADTYNHIVDNGIKIEIDIPEDEYCVKLDKYHFERCMSNIISNFIKYNEKGTKTHISLCKKNDKYILTMENDGTPIEKSIVKNLFDPLVTGDISRSSESTGLGLASAKRVVELHGGEIEYKNTQKYANSFIITLPIN